LLLGIHFQVRPSRSSAAAAAANSSSSSGRRKKKNRFQVVHHGLAKLKVDQTEEVAATFQQLDAFIQYFDSQEERNDYLERAIILREATLNLLRRSIADRMTQTTTDIQAALFPTSRTKIPTVRFVSADKLEASLIYTRFHGISYRSKSLLHILHTQMMIYSDHESYSANNNDSNNNNDNNNNNNNVYKELWDTCRNTYCHSRDSLLQNTLKSHLDKLRKQHELVGMTRLASVFLIRICTLETSLYLDFFGAPSYQKNTITSTNSKKDTTNDTTSNNNNNNNTTNANNTTNHWATQLMTPDGKYVDSEFQAYLDGLCANLYKTVRRGLVTLLDLDTLCQVVSVLREERTLANASPTTMATARAISNCTLDAQERLIFCANSQLAKRSSKIQTISRRPKLP